MDFFDWVWLTWLASFLVFEGVALARKERGDTLSENVWGVLFKGGRGGKVRVGPWIAMAVLLAWLVPHFLFGWLAG